MLAQIPFSNSYIQITSTLPLMEKCQDNWCGAQMSVPPTGRPGPTTVSQRDGCRHRFPANSKSNLPSWNAACRKQKFLTAKALRPESRVHSNQPSLSPTFIRESQMMSTKRGSYVCFLYWSFTSLQHLRLFVLYSHALVGLVSSLVVVFLSLLFYTTATVFKLYLDV